MISAWNAEGQIYSKAISRHDLAMPIARFPALRRVDSPSEAHFATFWRWYDDCHNPKGYCDELRPCLFRAWLTAQAKNAKGWTEFVQEAKRSRLAASDGRKSLKDALFE